METSRVIFSQYTWVPPPIPITTFDNYVSVWWCYGTKRHWLFQLPKDASVKLKQPYMLNVCPFKIKSNSKHFKSSSMAQKHAKWQIFIHVKTFTLGEKNPQKTCQEWKHWASGHFMKLFYKTTTRTRRPLLSILKSGCLIQAWLYFWIRVCLWLFKYKSILWNFNSKNFQSTNFFYLNLRISLTYIPFRLRKILTLM